MTELDFDLLAGSLRADGGDLHAFVESLAAKLEAALPSQTTVKRVRSGFRAPKQVTMIALDAGGERFQLERHGDHVHTTRALQSGGIVLKTEPLEPEEWITAVTQALAGEAQRSERTRQALERLLLNP
jgi:hypothetical protein